MTDSPSVHPLIQPFISDTPRMTPEPVPVNPDFARALIESGPINRGLRDYNIEKIARDMGDSEFRQTGEPMQISKTGKLLNAFHRCHAVIRSNTTQPFFIAFGLDDEIQKFVDIGVARTAADAFRMSGFRPDPQMCAAVALLAMNVEAGLVPKAELHKQGGGSTRWSRAEVLNYGEEHRQVLVDAVGAYSAGSRKPALRGMSPAAWVYSLYRLRMLDGLDRPNEFAETVVAMSTNGPGDPRNALLTYLAERTPILVRKGIPVDRIHSMRAPEALFITFKAYRAWFNGSKLSPNQLAPSNGALIPYPTEPEQKDSAATSAA